MSSLGLYAENEIFDNFGVICLGWCCLYRAVCLSCAPLALLPQLCAQCTASHHCSARGALLRRQRTRRTHAQFGLLRFTS